MGLSHRAGLCALLLVSGCAADMDLDEAAGIGFPVIDPGSPEEAGVLAFLNDPATTFEILDDDVGLDRRAARNLIDRRDGLPGTTSDDRPFESIEEVDAVSYVGAVALEQLLAWARDGGWIDDSTTDRDGAILALVNDPAVTFEILDDDVGLDRRAAENIVAARPFATLAALDAVPYVGPSALDDLAAYALANGFGGPPPMSSPPCAFISEVTEGQGTYNKGVEVQACGDAPLPLDEVFLCLVRNDDTTCSNRAALGAGTLAPGQVHTVCRTLDGTFNDPMESLREACAHAVSGAATFDGDDRLILFHDVDGDGDLTDADTVLDAFGDPAVRPTGTPWADVTLRRCDLTPRPEGTDVAAVFTSHARHDHTGLGDPASPDCGGAPPLGGEGDDCLEHAGCAEGLRCYGRPFDGSSPYGKCVDTTPIPGEGQDCDRWTPCQDGLICAGWTVWGEGTCNPQWMAGRFEMEAADPPINEGGGIAASVPVYGLASVPVDLEVVLHVTHPRPTDLVVTLLDPNGSSAVLWDQSDELGEWSRSHVRTGGISRDDTVNGRWTLRIRDVVSGEVGTFHSWSLFVTSRWD